MKKEEIPDFINCVIFIQNYWEKFKCTRIQAINGVVFDMLALIEGGIENYQENFEKILRAIEEEKKSRKLL